MNDVPYLVIESGEPDRQVLKTIDRFLNKVETVVDTDINLYGAGVSCVHAKINTSMGSTGTDIGHLYVYWFVNGCFSIQFFEEDVENNRPFLHWFRTRVSDGMKIQGTAVEGTETVERPNSSSSNNGSHPVSVLCTVLATIRGL